MWTGKLRSFPEKDLCRQEGLSPAMRFAGITRLTSFNEVDIYQSPESRAESALVFLDESLRQSVGLAHGNGQT